MVKKQKNICLFCSIGCGFIIETLFDEAVNLEYDREDPAGRGCLCSKGNYILELLNHPSRLIEPQAKGKVLGWKDALARAARDLNKHAEKSSLGLILGGDASVEDVAIAKLFVEKCLKNKRLAVHFATGDDSVYRALAESSISNPPAKLDDIEKSGCTIAVGDPFEIGPVISGRVFEAKYAQRGNILAVVSKKPNRTSRFASVHLGGSERKTLAGLLRTVVDISGKSGPAWKEVVKKKYPATDDSAVSNLSNTFVNTPSAIMILETQDPVTAQLAALIVEAAGKDKRLYCMNTYGNVSDICDVIGGNGSVEDMIGAAGSGELKALIVLGADIIKGSSGDDVKSSLKKAEYLVAGAPFENETTGIADMILPTALWLETEGTFNGKKVSPVIEPPGGALSYGEIIRRLAEEMGHALPSVSVKPVLGRKEPTDELVTSLLKDIEKEAPEPFLRSSTIKYADGSLTDNMSWIKLQKRGAW